MQSIQTWRVKKKPNTQHCLKKDNGMLKYLYQRRSSFDRLFWIPEQHNGLWWLARAVWTVFLPWQDPSARQRHRKCDALSNRGKLLKSLLLKFKARVRDMNLLHMNKVVRTYPRMCNNHLQYRTNIVTRICVILCLLQFWVGFYLNLMYHQLCNRKQIN